MDANKLQVLRDNEYAISGACGTCKHGQFKPGAAYGTCAVIGYNHLKHNDAARQLSIYRFGRCKDKYEFNDALRGEIGKFQEFIK